MFRSGGVLRRLPVTVCLAYLGPHAAASAYSAGRVRPALPTDESAEAGSGALWLHEIKHDGFRVIARKDGTG